MRCRAAEMGWPVYQWCYRETLEPHGWLTEDEVTRKRRERSRTMWETEDALPEPRTEGRAIDPAAVERMFDATRGAHVSPGELEHLWRGQPGPPAVALLGGVDVDLYRNVFAFSLAELQELKSLEVEGVRERIFAAGVVGAGRSARTAIMALAAERAEIGKKRGACLINDLRKRVDDLDEKLRQAKSRATRYPDLRRAADDRDEEQQRIGRGLTTARRERVELGRLQVETRHPLAIHARRDDLPEVLIRQRPTELAQPEIHAVHVAAEGPMAQPAVCHVEPGSRLDVGAGVRVISNALGE